jgi:hypothetical protein
MILVPSVRFEHSEILAGIFRRPSSPLSISGYIRSILLQIVSTKPSGENLAERNIRNEFIYRVILALNRLDTVASSPEISFTITTWINMLERLLKNQSVPFSGEPLSGIQIMGILETRILDFRNLIILSVNEGILPAITSASSFIPFSLREAFRLPSINHQESVYAYHFYRLLQRAENVTFVLNSNSEELRSGEMSRFLQQMKYDPVLKPQFLNLSFEIRNRTTIREELERMAEHQEQLISRFSSVEKDRYMSPSAVNMWLNCRMKFYYRYVCGLKEPESITEEIDPAMLGTLLHNVMKNLYREFTGRTVTAQEIEKILSGRQIILNHINITIKELFSRESSTTIAGNELIINEVLIVYIRRILEADKGYAPFKIFGLETPVRFPVTIGEGKNAIRLSAGGDIDRIDIKDGVTRIVDYKTGTIADSVSSIGDLFIDDRKKEPDGWLQTLLYCEGYLNKYPGEVVRPSVYKLKKIRSGDMFCIRSGKNNEIEINDYTTVRQEFIAGFQETLSKIFSIDEPFRMTCAQWTKCTLCPYRLLCLR